MTEALAELQSRWAEVARHLLVGGMPLLSVAWGDCSALSLHGDRLALAVPPRRAPLFADLEQQAQVVSAISAVTGNRLRLEVRVMGHQFAGSAGSAGSASGTGSEPTQDERTKKYIAAATHPLVQDLIRRFQAELIGRELVDVETWLVRLQQVHDPAKRRFAGDMALDDGGGDGD